LIREIVRRILISLLLVNSTFFPILKSKQY